MNSDRNFDYELDVLLNLDGLEYRRDKGYWIKIEAIKAKTTKFRPHGIRYSITLHDRNNNRGLGFDNAHGVSHPIRKKYSGRIVEYNHKHIGNRVFPYEFESPGQLLEDFFEEAEKIMSG